MRRGKQTLSRLEKRFWQSSNEKLTPTAFLLSKNASDGLNLPVKLISQKWV